MTNQVSTQSQTNSVALSNSVESINALTMNNSELRTIVVRWKNPTRCVAAAVPNTAWSEAKQSIPAAYLSLVEAVLESAAKDTIRRFVEAHNVLPSSMNGELFTTAALLETATTSATDWMTKEQLTAAWLESSTRKQLISDPRYSSSAEYRRAVTYFADLVQKFAGKTSHFLPTELDKVMARLTDDDLNSELGAFIVRRVTQLKNKPTTSAIDLDIL